MHRPSCCSPSLSHCRVSCVSFLSSHFSRISALLFARLRRRGCVAFETPFWSGPRQLSQPEAAGAELIPRDRQRRTAIRGADLILAEVGFGRGKGLRPLTDERAGRLVASVGQRRPHPAKPQGGFAGSIPSVSGPGAEAGAAWTPLPARRRSPPGTASEILSTRTKAARRYAGAPRDCRRRFPG